MNNSYDQSVVQTLTRWRADPLSFVKECLQAQPSQQQIAGLSELGRLVRSKEKAAAKMPMNEQERSYALKRGITIRSGHGTGKDAFAAWAIIWFKFLFASPDGQGSLIPCTAPTSNQLRSVLWQEVNKWLSRRSTSGNFLCPIKDSFYISNDRIYLTEGSNNPLKEKGMVIARTSGIGDSPEKQGETLAGFHAPFMMIVADEASGVPDPVFRPLEGAMTQDVNFMLLISNMTRTSGFFYDTHYHPISSNQFIRLHWNAEESENVSRDSIEMMARKYGVESNVYRVRVLGEPPTSEDNSLIPHDWCVYASQNQITPPDVAPVILALDVAHLGNDSSCAVIRKGGQVIAVEEAHKLETLKLAEWVLELDNVYQPTHVVIDICGIGVGIYDILRRYLPNKVRGVNVNSSSSHKEKFPRLRDELFWKLRVRFENRLISIPYDDSTFAEEISVLRYEITAQGKVDVESKMSLRKRGIESPNRLDALMLTMSINDEIYLKESDTLEDKAFDRYDAAFRKERRIRGTWMSN